VIRGILDDCFVSENHFIVAFGVVELFVCGFQFSFRNVVDFIDVMSWTFLSMIIEILLQF
jgi:hypothetical protein